MATSGNLYIENLDNIFDKYNNAYQKPIKNKMQMLFRYIC